MSIIFRAVSIASIVRDFGTTETVETRLATTQPSQSFRIASKVKVFSYDCLTTTWAIRTIIQILELNKLPSILQQRGLTIPYY